jgi:predicted ATPase with chaperone activity
MFGKRLSAIMPLLTLEEAPETTRIHSSAGKIDDHNALMTRILFRSPHHKISQDALVGGEIFPTYFLGQKHSVFVINLAQNADTRGQHPYLTGLPVSIRTDTK